jgi:hypothetical protein
MEAKDTPEQGKEIGGYQCPVHGEWIADSGTHSPFQGKPCPKCQCDSKLIYVEYKRWPNE